MIIDKKLIPYSVLSGTGLRGVIRHIVKNRSRIVFIRKEDGAVSGLLTNGDIMRLLAASETVDLSTEVDAVMNVDFVHANEDDSTEKIEKLLADIEILPVLDAYRRLKAVALRGKDFIQIGDFRIAHDSPAFIIGEIGINHNGSVEIARQLIDVCAEAGVDCAKFQMRDMDALYTNAGDANDARENLGSQYVLDLLSRFQLTIEEMLGLFDYCKEKNILPLCTPWDIPTLEQLESYGMEAYKVASADMTNLDLLEAMAKTGKPLIVSTGMSQEPEIEQAVRLMQRHGAQYVLLHCNSTYPAPFKDVHLNYLERLAKIGNCPVGYSGHERGRHIPLAAVALGAKVIEKHVTIDRAMEGNDHKVSLLPGELKEMVNQIRETESAMGKAEGREITQGEKMNRANLAKSIVINCDIKKGENITERMLSIKSPGRGLQPNYKKDLIGLAVNRDMTAGDFFYPSDLEKPVERQSEYRFKRPWGVPVRYYDYDRLMRGTNPDFIEFHLSYKDMDLDFRNFIKEKMDLGLVVHSPDLFTGDHLLDLSAKDPEYRKRSIYELQRVVDITRELKEFFPKAEKPFVIVSPGGFTKDRLLEKSERAELYDRIADSFSQLEDEGVEVIAQTLPPFPWYFGGQLYLNVFVDPWDTAEFCRQHNRRLCFDISHSKLACNHFKWSFKEFTDLVGPHSAHLHIVDAAGLDSEGLQINEGDIDFAALASDLERVSPDASFIPEIWQGHENDGEGFWVALNRLQKWF